LGHQFLKHIERAPVFIHLVDPTQPHAFRNFLAINRELKMWNREMIERPQLVAITKMDIVDEELAPEVEALKARFEARGCEVFTISAATQEGLVPLLERTMLLVEIEREKALLEPHPIPVSLTQSRIDKPLHIKEIARYADDKSEWDVTGGPMERLTGRFDMENSEAVFYIHRILERSGTLEELRKAGVKYGDLVHVANLTFEFGE
jgi:GTP-binding protein